MTRSDRFRRHDAAALVRYSPFELALMAVIAGSAILAFPTHAQAQESQDPRFQLRIGAMDADATSELTARTVFMGQPLSYTQDFDFGSDELSARVDGMFRLSDRQRLVFDYLGYDKDRTETLDRDLSYDDVTIPAGSYAKAEVEFQLASLMYDYSVVDTDTFELGLQIGAEWAKLEGTLQAEAGPYRYRNTAGGDGYAPVVGARMSFMPSEHWLINVQGQYLDADWGNFDGYDGSISRANALVQYNFNPTFGIYAGYDWFKLDANKSGRDGTLGLDQRFKGPIAGVAFSF